ncbi:MAG: methyltransferase, FxLD system [Chloroflexaceae bacterium]|jgi:protein-L-isoaspartate(D-aspartate) O-methyltransferase|nr:methyltransferase, FxLD system [Chloroflexaceae bacterium]
METSNEGALHQTLVAMLKEKKTIASPAVEAAFLAVPRHFFLPHLPLEQVYQDEAIPTKFDNGVPISSSSQPAIMALMLEQLALEPGQHVLEIGAGTGYNAALLAQLVGPTGSVTTIDIDDDIVTDARAHLLAAGFPQVRVVCGDGGLGYAEAAPYDRIMLTVGAWDIAPAWREQLRVGGRLLLPLSLRGPQKSIAFEKQADGSLRNLSIVECGFMRLRGAFAGSGTTLHLGPEPGLSLFVDSPPPAAADTIYDWLTGLHETSATGVDVPFLDIWRSLFLWLALRMEGTCMLGADGPVVERDLVPAFFSWTRQHRAYTTIGVVSERGLCAFAGPPEPTDQHMGREAVEQPQAEPAASPLEQRVRLHIRSYGNDPALLARLSAEILAWDATGHDFSRTMQLVVLPIEQPYTPVPGETVIERTWHRLVLRM